MRFTPEQLLAIVGRYVVEIPSHVTFPFASFAVDADDEDFPWVASVDETLCEEHIRRRLAMLAEDFTELCAKIPDYLSEAAGAEDSPEEPNASDEELSAYGARIGDRRVEDDSDPDETELSEEGMTVEEAREFLGNTVAVLTDMHARAETEANEGDMHMVMWRLGFIEAVLDSLSNVGVAHFNRDKVVATAWNYLLHVRPILLWSDLEGDDSATATGMPGVPNAVALHADDAREEVLADAVYLVGMIQGYLWYARVYKLGELPDHWEAKIMQ